MSKQEYEKKIKQQKMDEKYAEEAMLQNIIKLYFRDMENLKSKPLTAEREKELVELIRQGDSEARKELIESNLALVISIAQKYKRCGLPLLDVIQAGNEGLILAVEKFNPDKGRFSTCAFQWIKKMIKLALDNNRNIHIPDHVLRKIRALAETRKKLKAENPEEPANAKLAEAMGISEEKLEDLLMIEAIQPDSLQRIVYGEKDDAVTLGELLVDIDGKDDEYSEMLSHKTVNYTMEELRMVFFEEEEAQKLYELYLSGAKTAKINDFIKEYKLDQDEVEKLRDCIFTKVKEAVAVIPENFNKSVNYQELSEEESLLKLLASGQTTGLMQSQDAYARIFAGMEEINFEEYDQCWEMHFEEENYDRMLEEEILLNQIKKIGSVAYEKYVLRYLLAHYHLEITMENRVACIAAVSECLREEYKEGGVEKKNWDDYFQELIEKLDEEKLNELALATGMDIQVYTVFRKKVLKCKDYDYLDMDFICMYFTLKYAKECSQVSYRKAFDKLKELYNENNLLEEEFLSDRLDIESSQAMGNKLFLDMESAEGLKQKYRELLFEERIDKLTAVFQRISELKRRKILRSEEIVFHEQWKEFNVNFMQYENEWLMENDQATKKGKNKHLSREMIYDFLYGDRKVKTKQTAGCYLGTDNFTSSLINNNVFSRFAGKQGYKKRNLILTLVFLNFTYELDEMEKEESLDYFNRVSLFEYKVWNILSPCGYMMLHSENAYDSFLKLLLSCSEPRDLFRYIWKNREELITRCIGEKRNEFL